MSKRILVVDDDQAIQATLQELLESEGYEVDIASDGLIALEKLDHPCENYDRVLLDLSMLHMDGLQLIQALRCQQEALLLSIIVLSGDRDAIQQAVGMGIHHFLVKPFDLGTLLALVSTCS